MGLPRSQYIFFSEQNITVVAISFAIDFFAEEFRIHNFNQQIVFQQSKSNGQIDVRFAVLRSLHISSLNFQLKSEQHRPQIINTIVGHCEQIAATLFSKKSFAFSSKSRKLLRRHENPALPRSNTSHFDVLSLYGCIFVYVVCTLKLTTFSLCSIKKTLHRMRFWVLLETGRSSLAGPYQYFRSQLQKPCHLCGQGRLPKNAEMNIAYYNQCYPFRTGTLLWRRVFCSVVKTRLKKLRNVWGGRCVLSWVLFWGRFESSSRCYVGHTEQLLAHVFVKENSSLSLRYDTGRS